MVAGARHESRNARRNKSEPVRHQFVFGGTHVLFASHCGSGHRDVRRCLRQRQSGISCLAVTGGNTGTPADADSRTSTHRNTRASPGRATDDSTSRATRTAASRATHASAGRHISVRHDPQGRRGPWRQSLRS